MNARERYVETLSFGCPDRACFFHAYGVMSGVLERWQSEGLPPKVTEQEISGYSGLDLAARVPHNDPTT